MSAEENVEEITTPGAAEGSGDPALDEGAAAIAAALQGHNGNAGSAVESLFSNAGVMQMLQNHLGGMAGISSGLLESLPPAVKRRVKALKRVQASNVKVEADFQKELLALELKYQKLYQPLYDKRAAIISGEYEPTDEECEWADSEDEGEDEADAAGPSDDAEETGDDEKGIPYFWLTCLQNCPPVEEMIEDHDVPILRSLKHVRIEQEEAGSFTLFFDFEPNEFFTDNTLTKKYVVNLDPDEGALVYEGLSYEHAEGCKINWKDGKDPTITTIKKKQRKRAGAGAGKVRTVTKTEKRPSFFRFFSPPVPPAPEVELDPEDEEQLEMQLFQDFELADFFKDKVIPRAVLWFTGEAMDYEEDMLGEDDDDDMGDLDDDDDDDDDPDYVPPKDGEQPAECKQS